MPVMIFQDLLMNLALAFARVEARPNAELEPGPDQLDVLQSLNRKCITFAFPVSLLNFQYFTATDRIGY